MLFVGFGMTDDNFHRCATDCRRAVRSCDSGERKRENERVRPAVCYVCSVVNAVKKAVAPAQEKKAKKESFGTSLFLLNNELMAEVLASPARRCFWYFVVERVCMCFSMCVMTAQLWAGDIDLVPMDTARAAPWRGRLCWPTAFATLTARSVFGGGS